MSTENFVKFYGEYLSKHADVKAKIDGAESAKKFAALVMEHGKKAGFDFNEKDVDQVLITSLKKGAKGQLSEGQLEGVVGGIAGGSISFSSVKSLTGLNVGNAASTVMCPGFMPTGGAVE
jgi:hypothetical protein